jgi:hypothetical protein
MIRKDRKDGSKIKAMKIFTGVSIIIGVAAWLMSCDRNDHMGTLSVTSSSDMVCKGNNALKSNDPAPEISCIQYSYDGDSLLVLHHVNAGFNCCPGSFSVDIEVKGDSLIIREDDVQHLCRCNCIYDLDIQVHNLPADSYHVRIVEPYVHPTWPHLIFDVDLAKKPEGEFCVTRQEGWWR